MWNKYVLFVSCSEINLCTVKILIGWGRNWNNDHEHHGIQYIHNIKKYKINHKSDHDYQMTDHQYEAKWFGLLSVHGDTIWLHLFLFGLASP